jgi:RNase P/RNase MRP subunit p30
MISKMRLLLSTCRKRGAGFIFATLAGDEGQMRSARELSAFAAVLGATDVERKAAEKRMKQLADGGEGAAQGERKAAEKKPKGLVEK